MAVGNVAVALAGTGMAALGVFLATRDEAQLAVRVLGAYFVMRGIVNMSNGVSKLIGGIQQGFATDLAMYVDALGSPFAVMIPFMVLVFASLYPRRRGPVGKNATVRRGVYGVMLLAGLLVALQPGALFLRPPMGPGPSWLVDAEPLVLGIQLIPASYVIAGLVFVRDYLHEAPVPDRDGLLLVAVGLSFDGAYLGTIHFAGLLDPSLALRPGYYTHPWVLLGLAVGLGLLARHALRTEEPDERRKATWTMLGLLAPVLLYLLVTQPTIQLGGWPSRFITNALSIAIFPLLVAYGVLRQDLLGLDINLNLSRGVRYAALAGGLLVVYALVTIVAETQLGGVAGQTVAVVTTGLLVLATIPLSQAWRGEARTVLGLGSEPYLDREALDVYQETLEEALAAGDGELAGDDERMLARMRERLGVTDREHAVLLHALEAGTNVGEGAALLSPGRTVAGRYRVDDELATGGHGATYRATDTQLDRDVVLKQLYHPDGDGSLELDEEARRIGSLAHPTIVTVHDVLMLGERVLLVMEHVSGGSLADRLEDGPLELETFEKVAMDSLTALEVVHEAGMVHRDVKPGNLLLTADGGAKLTDFGISHVTSAETTMGLAADEPVGTLHYLSPEQAKGRPVDERSDLFSLAATLFEAYTGDPYIPVDPGESLAEAQMRVASLDGFDADLDAPDALQEWFGKALAPRAEDRFSSAREMREALSDALVEA